MNNKIISKILLFFLVIATLGTPTQWLWADLQGDINALESSIAAKTDKIEALQAEQAKYESLIQSKKSEALSLANELDIVNSRLLKTNLSIEELGLNIEKLEEEIVYLELSIQSKTEKIDKEISYLSSILREINYQDDIDAINALLMYDNLSEYFESVSAYNSLQEDLQMTVDTIQDEKIQLESNKAQLEEKQVKLEDEKVVLESEKAKLQEEITVKEFYLREVENSESKFQELLRSAKSSENAMDMEMRNLENNLRVKLEEQKAEERRKQEANQANNAKELSFLDQDAVLRWPVPPNRGISCIFHAPDYPYRYLFEHSGIDIRAYQSTPLQAAESGYVAKAKDNGLGYSYIMIIHADGLSTVYGHVSRIDVKEGQYVSKGDVIGASGGMPGTPGAGRYTTGPHLHFEVRLNGIPVDPQLYLP